MIKCADISNVARTLEISSRWGEILTEEFLEIADLERNLGIKPTTSSLARDATASERHLALAKGQLFFIDTYGRPLFRAISRVLPELGYTIDFIDSNEAEWRDVVSAAASAAK
jgi:3',5'-cyclic-nucleotide phosphodiesterase